RILSAGINAPTNDHMRDWAFVLIDDKEVIASVLQKIPEKVTGGRTEFIIKSWGLRDECQQNMYRDAIPKQHAMLRQSGCLILPFFKQRGDLLTPKNLSSLNAFASIWCCIENILLAAAAEGLACALRIPFDEESEHIAGILHHPKDYNMPCYIALGYPAPDAAISRQIEHSVEDKIHHNGW
ncbi:MAG: nitroreductase family protein, partial [Clostridia bacterium]|nr:nitroreductase family protein [Clostridia bacterium]